MTLIVGLGNPDKKYANNRHNVGFMVIDSLVSDLSPSKINKRDFKGELFKEKDLLLLKPHTYMNLSGESVRAVKEYFDISKIIVVHDDLELKLGTVRFKFGGGHAGHNGLKSIDTHIGKDYYRVRIGVGRPKEKTQVTSYVLSDFSQKQKEFLGTIIKTAKEASLALAENDLEYVCQRFTMKSDFDKEVVG